MHNREGINAMYVRPAELRDCPEIARLHVDVWREVYSYIPETVHFNRNYDYRLKQWRSEVSYAQKLVMA